MMPLDEIRKALADRRIGMVAAATGVHRQTLYTLMKDPASNPTHRTIKALSDYLSTGAL